MHKNINKLTITLNILDKTSFVLVKAVQSLSEKWQKLKFDPYRVK